MLSRKPDVERDGARRRSWASIEDLRNRIVNGRAYQNVEEATEGGSEGVQSTHIENASDEWMRDVDFAAFRSRRATQVEVARPASTRLLFSLACRENPAIQFQNDVDGAVQGWFSRDFKRRYQMTRIPDRRPWPEFSATMRTGFGYSSVDASAIAMICDTCVADVTAAGELVLPRRCRDMPLADFYVFDVRTGDEIPLGEFVAKAHSHDRKRDSAITRASRLAMTFSDMPRNVLQSKIAARVAELRAFVSTRDILDVASKESVRA